MLLSLLLVLAVAASAETCPPFPAPCAIFIPSTATLSVGGCILPGAHCTGDTSIVLTDGTATIAQNDDGFNTSACGLCSYLEYTNVGSNGINATLEQSCFSKDRCGGTTVYTLSGGGATAQELPGPAASALPSPPTLARSATVAILAVSLVVGLLSAGLSAGALWVALRTRKTNNAK